jgi:CheY-like chemotaxis protein
MKKRVYVIDDDRNIVDAVKMILQQKGFEVGFQYDDENFIENSVKFNPDLIILDVIFPENDAAGFEMARVLKKDEKTKHIPILMLSAVNEKGSYAGTFSNRDRDDSLLPVDEFVDKPVIPTILVDKVTRLTS